MMQLDVIPTQDQKMPDTIVGLIAVILALYLLTVIFWPGKF
jgi:K+-transporting ATPase KdpF subunit